MIFTGRESSIDRSAGDRSGSRISGIAMGMAALINLAAAVLSRRSSSQSSLVPMFDGGHSSSIAAGVATSPDAGHRSIGMLIPDAMLPILERHRPSGVLLRRGG